MAMSNKFTPPIELPSIWGTRVQAESPLTKEAHPQSYHLYGALLFTVAICDR